jgi:hypothetical protein
MLSERGLVVLGAEPLAAVQAALRDATSMATPAK